MGIGLASPAWPLDVQASQAVARFASTNAANGSVIELQNKSGAVSSLGAINFNNAANSYPGQIAYTSTDAMTFRTATAERMRIDSLGNVGIGTNNPQSALHVNGTVAANALRAPGAGVGTGTFAFIHKATGANISGHITTIDHPLCNGDPNAILIVTHNYNASGQYETHPFGTWYNGSARWTIYHEDIAAMPTNQAFNVMVIKP